MYFILSSTFFELIWIPSIGMRGPWKGFCLRPKHSSPPTVIYKFRTSQRPASIAASKHPDIFLLEYKQVSVFYHRTIAEEYKSMFAESY